MKLNDKVYDVLKWMALIAIPAVGVFYSAMAGAWDLPYADAISQTCNALAVFIGALIGVSSINYTSSIEVEGDGDYEEDVPDNETDEAQG